MDCYSVSSGGLFHFYAFNPHPVSYKRGYVIAGGVGKNTTKGGWSMKSVLATFLIIVAFIGGFLFDGLMTRVPKDASTRGRLMRLKRDIAAFYDQNGILPTSLDALNMSNSASDKSVPMENAWGGPILYSVSNGTTVILTTYGPGGVESEVKQTFSLTFDVNER